MVYRAIGLMSGSSLDGLDIAFVEFHENGGKWNFLIQETECYAYDDEWKARLKKATSLTALDYQHLHADYGHYLGQKINQFIDEKGLQYKVALISSHGHTTFHVPSRKLTSQLGDGAAIAAETRLPVVSDLRALDVAFGGQGAPIVPIGEKILLGDFSYFLNLGGIANVSSNAEKYVAFDVCAANRVLNLLANELAEDYDDGGNFASKGKIDNTLLQTLNDLDYYKQPYPKSLANEFGTDTVFKIVRENELEIHDALRTYTEHIAIQVKNAIAVLKADKPEEENAQLLVTGGGAFNTFLMKRLKMLLGEIGVAVMVPDESLVKYKEAMIMAFIGILRWREEYNVISTVTGATRNSVGGALWMGQDS
jgi:anhydro-N-acetylmuramic acid kinase